MTTYISIIFKIIDRLKKRPLLAPEVGIMVNRQRIRPLYKPGGYFIFTDLSPGETLFEIESPIFQKESVYAEIAPAGRGYEMKHLMLNPTRAYSFGGPVTTVSGKIFAGEALLSNHKFHMIPGDGGEAMKIAEDKAESGNCDLKLFVSAPEWQLSFPGQYIIKDKEEIKREFCMITQGGDRDGRYPLEKGMKYSHSRGTPLVGVIECTTSADGSFFTVLPHLKGDKAPLDFLIVNGKGLRKTMEIKTNRENNLGDMKI